MVSTNGSPDSRPMDIQVSPVRKKNVTARPVVDWEKWAAALTKGPAELLVALPHHVQKGGTSILEIGKSHLKTTLIDATYVIGGTMVPAVHPIFLLLGCETTEAIIPLERAPAVLLEHGAAIVVATIATLLPADAGAIACRLAELLIDARGTGASVGDVLRRARQTLLCEGNPMALALAGFGDADWVMA